MIDYSSFYKNIVKTSKNRFRIKLAFKTEQTLTQ